MPFQSRFQSRIPGLTVTDDLNSITTLQELGKEQGYKESKSFSALNAASRVLNFTNAATAGAVRGLLTKEGLLKSTSRSIKENSSWTDIYKDLGWKPQTKSERFVKGAVGFASDVLFDPLTYLTFGTSGALKIGGKAIAKGTATKAVKTAEKEIFTSSYENLLKEGLEESTAKILAREESNKTINKLLDEAISVDGLTTKTFDDVISKVVDTKNIDYIKDVGANLLDKGGIKWFGKQLVTSERLANSLVGKTARKIGEQEVVVALKNTFGRMFVYGFQKNPAVLKIFEKLDFTQKRAINETVKMLRKEIDGVPNEGVYNVMKSAYAKKRSLIKIENDIIKGIKSDFKKQFPKEKFPESFEEIEKVAQERTATLTKHIENLTQNISNKTIVDLEQKIAEARKALKELTPKSAIKKAAVTISEEDFAKGLDFAFGLKEQKLQEKLLELEKLAKTASKEVPKDAKIITKKVTSGLSKEEKAAQLLKDIKKIQNDVVQKSNFLTKAANARRAAKQQLSLETLTKTINDVPFTEAEQKLADNLFNKKDSLISQLAREAGLPEEDAIKFYLTETLDDAITIKEFATGRNLTPNLNMTKTYKGLTDVAETLTEKNARKNLLRTFTQVKTAKLKTEAVSETIQVLGKPFKEMTEKQAKELGYKLLNKKTLAGEIKGWLPEEIYDQVISHLEPRSSLINDLASATGFDYVTGLFKGYVTQLFPGFHTRNLAGNEWNSFLEYGMSVFNPKTSKLSISLLRGKNLDQKIIDKFGNEFTLKEIKELIMKNSDLLDNIGAFSDNELFLNGIDRLSKAQLFNPFSRQNVALGAGKKIGQAVEDFSKLRNVLVGVTQGLPIDDAIKRSEKALFNYNKLTPFEKDVMRRLIPFYTFARKNMEFQLKTLASNPGRVSSQFKLLRGIGNSIAGDNEFDDDTKLPHWIVNSMGIKTGYNALGQMQVMTGFGVPTEEFLQRFSGEKGIVWNTINNVLSQMNPLIKAPLERATDKDFFRNRPISEISGGESIKWMIDAMDKTPGGLGDQFKSMIQWKEIPNVPIYVNGRKVGTKTKYTANPFALHFFRNLPSSRIQSTISMIADPKNSALNNALRFFTGVSNWSIDSEAQNFYDDLEKKKEVQKFLQRMGIINIKEIPYYRK